MKYLYSVATGAINPFMKPSRDAVAFMRKQEGFVAIHPENEHTLFLYDSRNNAKIARNMAISKGIKCGNNICRFRWEKDTIVFDEPSCK